MDASTEPQLREPLNMPFPHIPDEETFYKVFRDEELWRPAIEELLEEEYIDYEPSNLHRVSGGSNLIYTLDDERILKVFPAITIEEYEVEFDLLEAFGQADLGLPTASLLERGVYDGWGWGVMTSLDGTVGREIWDDVPHEDRARLVAQVGDWMAASWEAEEVQSVVLPDARADWAAAQEKFRAELHAKHLKRKARPEHLAEIEVLMSDWEPRSEAVTIHADLHLGNMLFSDESGRWEISGVLDFADSLVAPKIYDLSTPLLSLTRGNPKLTEILFHHTLGPNHGESARVMMQWILLHRFFHIPYTLERDWVPKECTTLAQLGRVLSGLE